MNRFFLGILFLCFLSFNTSAQEYVAPVLYNPFVAAKQPLKNAKKTTASLALPFFEDFTGYDIFPDNNKWADHQVYINNTMCVKPISRGVATFDALNSRGLPYDSFSNSVFRYADSLTSNPIDLSSVFPSDSLYLSFFYQPQGNGFYPLLQDSLILYFKTKVGGYVKIWSVAGSTLKPFQQVMIPVSDTLYLANGFQFRFVNKAALFWSDAIWNVDYIRLNTGRNMFDTAVSDIGIASNPSSLLNDYTSMPYRQFIANPASERVTQLWDSIRNNYGTPQNINYTFTAKALNTGATLQAPTSAAATIGSHATQRVTTPSYSTTIPAGYYDKVVFEHKFYINSISSTDPTANDTIVANQTFDNYLAYDDGTAEKSYYLKLFPTLPGEVTIEHHLNQPDTMKGMAIYFGRQIPFATYKFFSIKVYSAIAGINGAITTDSLYQQDLCSPGYADTVNHFWYYKFDNPVPLPAGTFYAGILQPAESGADSIYLGLDVNRFGGNHAYYNVLASWSPSLMSGAIMMRPLLGQNIVGSAVNDVQANLNWHIFPNPASDKLQIEAKGDATRSYRICDLQGHTQLSGSIYKNETVNVSTLAPGMYFITLTEDGISGVPQRFIKL